MTFRFSLVSTGRDWVGLGSVAGTRGWTAFCLKQSQTYQQVLDGRDSHASLRKIITVVRIVDLNQITSVLYRSPR
jgi:hypothetical protein